MMEKASRSPLMKAVRILHAVAKEAAAVSLADLSAAARLPKPTAHRLMSELERLRLVARDPLTRRYRVGSDLEDLAVEAMRNTVSQSGRRLHMERLAEKIGERINIGVMSAGKIVYVDWVESAGPLRIAVPAGTQVPAHCSANGKLLLAYGPPALRRRILASSPFASFTPTTITTAEALARELETIRRQGYSEDNEEFLAGVCCLAVPMRNRRGEVVAGLAVMAPSARLPLARALQHLPDLRACAEAISAELQSRTRRGPPTGVPRHTRKRRTA
jgi:IclR family transcriptional regulator, acetate operon repressor